MPPPLTTRLKRLGAALFTAASVSPTVAGEAAHGIAIHGGAGTLLREEMTPEKEAAYHAKLAEATVRPSRTPPTRRPRSTRR